MSMNCIVKMFKFLVLRVCLCVFISLCMSMCVYMRLRNEVCMCLHVCWMVMFVLVDVFACFALICFKLCGKHISYESFTDNKR